MRLLTKAALVAAASGLALTATAVVAQDYPWQPDRPINVIVPWGAGGSTDQVIRVLTPIIAEALNQAVVVVNQPGASGATGTAEVLAAAPDGYTWTGNAIANNATYHVSGLLEGTSINDWHAYLAVANVPLISVPADSEFDDFGALLEALRERGQGVTVGTAGVTSSGGTAIAALSQAGGFEYRMVAYDGGGPAATATAAGEVMVTSQLAVEQAELVRGGRLKALAVLSDRPLEIEGVDPIPPVTDWLPDMPIYPDYFGILVPAGVPDEVIATLNAVWEDHVANAESLRNYAVTNGAVAAPAYGEEALAIVIPVIIEKACAALARDEAANDPSTIGIDCETHSLID
jgi:tripartite-type tricarboxylate transporter receptor subunit TctC